MKFMKVKPSPNGGNPPHCREYGEKLCAKIAKALGTPKENGWHRCPDGTEVKVGTYMVYGSVYNRAPSPVMIAMDGQPFTLWEGNADRRFKGLAISAMSDIF